MTELQRADMKDISVVLAVMDQDRWLTLLSNILRPVMSDCVCVQTLRRGGAGARHDHAEGGQADGGGPRQVLLPLPSRPDQAGQQLSVSVV